MAQELPIEYGGTGAANADEAKANLDVPTENRLKGNQLPALEGSTGHPLASAVPTNYPDQAEPAAGYKFIGAATNVTFDAGLWKGTGQLQRKYKRDAAGFISKTSEYAGVRLHDNTQLRALVDDIATNGCSVTDDVDYVYVTFELSDLPDGVKFPFIAAEVGTVAEIGDDDSLFSGHDFGDGADYIDPDALGANPTAKIYPDGSIVGSTDFGQYTKYQNGDLICRLTSNITSTQLVNYPVEFMDLTYSFILARATNGVEAGTILFGNRTTTTVLLTMQTATTTEFSYVAMGRWK